MSSAIIKMKRGSETDLAEVSKSILDDFKGDVAELSMEQMSEVNGVKVLLLILERYYMRNGSMAVSTVQIIDSGEVQQATIIGTGGGEGLMNISLGANQDFARRVAKVLAKLGFEEIDFEEGQTTYLYVITMIAAALTIYFSLDEYKKGSMSTRNFKIICVCESVVLLSQLYFLLT